MNDRATSYDALSSKRIDIADDDEVRFWMREFGVSAGDLNEAVITVGTSARLVGVYLRDVPRKA